MSVATSAVTLAGPVRRPKRGRPARLSREIIVAAALESNLDTLTVRDLAARLGVTHGALYRWVPGQEALLNLVIEALVDRVVPADDPRRGQWRACREACEAVRRAGTNATMSEPAAAVGSVQLARLGTFGP